MHDSTVLQGITVQEDIWRPTVTLVPKRIKDKKQSDGMKKAKTSSPWSSLVIIRNYLSVGGKKKQKKPRIINEQNATLQQ